MEEKSILLNSESKPLINQHQEILMTKTLGSGESLDTHEDKPLTADSFAFGFNPLLMTATSLDKAKKKKKSPVSASVTKSVVPSVAASTSLDIAKAPVVQALVENNVEKVDEIIEKEINDVVVKPTSNKDKKPEHIVMPTININDHKSSMITPTTGGQESVNVLGTQRNKRFKSSGGTEYEIDYRFKFKLKIPPPPRYIKIVKVFPSADVSGTKRETSPYAYVMPPARIQLNASPMTPEEAMTKFSNGEISKSELDAVVAMDFRVTSPKTKQLLSVEKLNLENSENTYAGW
jgi:hypothetical protein